METMTFLLTLFLFLYIRSHFVILLLANVFSVIRSTDYTIAIGSFNPFISQLQDEICRPWPLPPLLLVTTYAIICL